MFKIKVMDLTKTKKLKHLEKETFFLQMKNPFITLYNGDDYNNGCRLSMILFDKDSIPWKIALNFILFAQFLVLHWK